MTIIVLPIFLFLIIYFFEKLYFAGRVIYVLTPYLIAKIMDTVKERFSVLLKPSYPNMTTTNGYDVIKYVCDGKEYKHCIITANRFNDIILIMNDDGVDITRQVLPYLGPDKNVSTVVPQLWNTKSLTFEMVNGTTVTIR
jgi:hypothetical protein